MDHYTVACWQGMAELTEGMIWDDLEIFVDHTGESYE